MVKSIITTFFCKYQSLLLLLVVVIHNKFTWHVIWVNINLGEALLCQFLVESVEGQLSCHYTSLEVHLPNRRRQCIRIPFGVQALFLYYWNLSKKNAGCFSSFSAGWYYTNTIMWAKSMCLHIYIHICSVGNEYIT